MKTYKIASEAADHFVIDHGDGATYKVAKKGLSKVVTDKIRKFADGGTVPASPNLDPNVLADPHAVQQLLAQQKQAEGMNAVGRAIASVFKKPTPTMGPETGGETDTRSLAEMGIKPLEGSPAAEAATAATAVPAAAATAAPAAAEAPTAGPSGGELGALGKAEKAKEEAVKAAGDLAVKKGNEIAQDQADYQTQAKNILDRHSQQWGALQTRIDQANEDIKNSKIDPDRYWNSKSTGQKIGSTIAMALGAFGASFSHTPNFVQEQINKAIDRDMESQKADLGKKENLVSQYMRQGHDLMASTQLAKAELRDVASSKLAEKAAKYLGPEQQAAAAQQIADMRRQSVMDRETLKAHSLDSQMKQLQVTSGSLGLDVKKQEVAALQTLAKTGQVTPEILPFLPKEFKARYAPKASEEEVKEQIQQAPKLGIGEALAAKIPGSETGHKVDAWVSNTADSILRMRGEKPSTRNPMWKELTADLNNVASLRPGVREAALKRVASKYSTARYARQSGFAAPSGGATAEQETE